ncbi:alpha/beta fold hydrolase [Brassicibacter mesophilus]|uniref:alpha/beta hydrolase n=1 Tax=Brassicibacter mesophilus TaxID=745119 RepID=UPI003D1E051B
MIDKEYYLKKKNGNKLYLNILENGKELPNIIFIQTPITSVADLKDTYLPLSKHGFNVFALDLSGCGKSDGDMREFSLENVNEDITACVDYIISNYNDIIHFYAGHGMGGMLAQYYLSHKRPIASFAQYGVAIPKDLSIAKKPLLAKASYPFLLIINKLFPRLRINFELIANMKGYNGKNAEKENAWYEEIIRKNTKITQLPIAFITNLFKMFISKKSDLNNKPQCPVLFFAPKHDRYVDFSYFQKYYNWLNEPKQMYIIDDSHLSFVWHAEELCEAACEWFRKYN